MSISAPSTGQLLDISPASSVLGHLTDECAAPSGLPEILLGRTETQAAFSINVKTGRWADFATGDKGGDVISLAAYIFRCRQIEAARTLAATLGVEVRQ